MRREELGAIFFGTWWGNGANCNKISRSTFHWECGWCGWTRAEFLSRECGIEYAMQSLPCREGAEEGAEGAEYCLFQLPRSNTCACACVGIGGVRDRAARRGWRGQML